MSLDYFLHEVQRWQSWVFAVFIMVACTGYVVLTGKKHGSTGRFRNRVFRCVASTVRYPNLGTRIAAVLMASGFSYVALARWGDREPEAFTKILVTTGMSLLVISTLGVAFWRMIKHGRYRETLTMSKSHPILSTGDFQ